MLTNIDDLRREVWTALTGLTSNERLNANCWSNEYATTVIRLSNSALGAVPNVKVLEIVREIREEMRRKAEADLQKLELCFDTSDLGRVTHVLVPEAPGCSTSTLCGLDAWPVSKIDAKCLECEGCRSILRLVYSRRKEDV